MNTFSCIIPFYNEGQQVLKIIDATTKVPSIDQIIVVDDGSTERISSLITEKFPDVEVATLLTNQGKSAAVYAGLKKVKNEHIVMFDADYRNVNASELLQIIRKYTESGVDMLLLQVKGGNNLIDQLVRKEILFTGFRILKTKDLQAVFLMNPAGYQLEAAINEYMMRNHKKVRWLPSRITNVHKTEKWGFIRGYKSSIQMELSILMYLGLPNFLNQIYSFAKFKLNTGSEHY